MTEKAKEEEEAKDTKENSYDVVQHLFLEPSKILLPLFPEASPLRCLLFVSVGTVALVALSGLVAFALFFLAATINAIFVSLLISLAVAGGFLALFFAFVTAIYIGALSLAIFAISTVTFWAIVVIIITAGWVGFFYSVWLVTRKGVGFAKQSLSMTDSAINTYSTARGTRNLPPKD